MLTHFQHRLSLAALVNQHPAQTESSSATLLEALLNQSCLLYTSIRQKFVKCVDDKDQLLIAKPGFAYQQFLFLAFAPVSIHKTLGARQLFPSGAVAGIPLFAGEPSLINQALHRANGLSLIHI